MQSYREAPEARPKSGNQSGWGSGDPSRGDTLIGRLVDGRYEIGDLVARGGMASVYEATDTRLNRTVAVKVMHPGMGDDDAFAARFVREAHAAARLSHPNVVAVFDQGNDDGVVFLAMEYVPGETLRDVIRRDAPLSPADALALLEPVASALSAAHRAGLIHRDVKPENVLIEEPTSGGRVKVADFGLAKAVSADTQHTVTGGVLIGTVSYLAPELVVDGRADARADVYAAGVVLYELLTGHKPHEGESPIAVAYKHVHADVPPPSALVPGIPAYVDALVARATARDRTQRPADAGVLLHQVHRVAQALREGVRDDVELTADLVPRVLPAPVTEQTTALEALAVRAAQPLPHSSDDSFDPVELANDPVPIAAPVVTPAKVMLREEVMAQRSPTAAPSSTARTRPSGRAGRPRRSRRGPILLLLALLLVAGGGAGAYWFGYARYTTTPGVIGMGQTTAIDRLERAGLSGQADDGSYSETVPVGEVIGTDPEPGSRILADSSVTLTLSLGKERYDVPPIEGQNEDRAQDALADTNLSFGKSVERWSETVGAGLVIRADPPVGKTLKPGTAVNLVLSKGRRPVKVKDWTGLDGDRADQALTKRGLVVEQVGEEFDDDVPQGYVLTQSPASGSLFRGETVELTLSKGPELVAVPDGLIATGVDAATEMLESAGFGVEVEEGASYLGLRYVMDVDPGSGTLVPKGSTITLYLV